MINWIISSSALIAAIAAVRCLFKGRINPRLQYMLWLLVMLRLLLPVNIGQSAASIMNYVPEREAVSREAVQAQLAEAPQSPVQPGAVEPETVQPVTAPQPEKNTGLDELNEPITGKTGQPAEPIYPEEKPDRTALLKMLWLTGAGTVALCVLGSNLRFYWKLRRSRRMLHTYKGLPVYECAWLETPCMFGLFRPAIYMSAGISAEQMEHVLCHEYSHYRQGDHIWALLRGCCLALHWYNPLVWLAARLSKRDGELACDERVTRSLDSEERIRYGQTLISLSCAARSPIFCTATTMAGKGRELKERVEYIARRPRMMAWTMAVILLVAAFAAGCTFTGAKTEEQPEETVTVDVTAEPSSEAAAVPEPTATAEPASSASPLAGRIMDRNGQPLDPSLYPGLEGVETAFKTYLTMGDSVNLTIDLALQQRAQAILEEHLDHSGGAAVVVDVNTGEPLAILSNGGGGNKALMSAYQPEGLFLPCTGIAALRKNIITVDYEIKCEGVFDRYEDDGFAPECWIWNSVDGQHYVHDKENLAEALRDSCYYYFYCLGNDLGIDETANCAESLGLGQPTGIELPEITGTLANYHTPLGTGNEWRIGDTLEAVVGRSTNAFTPLQIAEYCAAIANNGQRYSASVLAEVTGQDGSVRYTRQPEVLSSVLDEQKQELYRIVNSWKQIVDGNWAAVHQGMYDAMNDYIHNSNNAEIWQSSTWKVAGMVHRGLFMGYAPYSEPQIAISVVTENPSNAALAQEIARDILNAYVEINR